MASLEERIAIELRRVLDHQEQGGFGAPPNTERGMAIGGADEPSIVLTVEDVARIAARVARMPDLSQKPKMTAKEWDAEAAKHGFVSTPEGRAWARRVLAEARERSAQVDFVGIRRHLEEFGCFPNPSDPTSATPARPADEAV